MPRAKFWDLVVVGLIITISYHSGKLGARLALVRAICSVCNREGHLQVRGNSARIGHYMGYEGKTRLVEWHRVDGINLEMLNNGKQSLVNKTLNLGFNSLTQTGRGCPISANN